VRAFYHLMAVKAIASEGPCPKSLMKIEQLATSRLSFSISSCSASVEDFCTRSSNGPKTEPQRSLTV